MLAAHVCTYNARDRVFAVRAFVYASDYIMAGSGGASLPFGIAPRHFSRIHHENTPLASTVTSLSSMTDHRSGVVAQAARLSDLMLPTNDLGLSRRNMIASQFFKRERERKRDLASFLYVLSSLV